MLEFQLEHNKYRAGSLVPCVYKIFPVTGRKVGGGKSSSSRRNAGGRRLVLKPLMCLGVKLDENLNWDSHITLICKKVSAAIGVMRRMKPFVPMHTLESVYKSLVQPYFDYCSPLWDTCGKLLRDKLQKFQSRAARIVTGANYESRSADVLNSLLWDTLENRRSGAKSVLMYKILNDHTAPALRGSFVGREMDQTNYNLRNTATDLTLPKPKR